MVVDQNEDLATMKESEILNLFEKNLTIPLASRIYGIGMARRAKLAEEVRKKNRHDDNIRNIARAKRFVMEFER